ncbi:MAG: polysaccharide biosynthesis/export family protein [Bryobacteraceae bacterium]
MIALALAPGCAGAGLQATSAAPQTAAPGSSEAQSPAPGSPAAPQAAPPGSSAPGADQPDEKTYVIGVQDVLGVQVYGQPEFNIPYTVGPDGKITLPHAGDVTASGRTRDDLAKDIADRLVKAGIKDPLVTVALEASHSRQYYIQGQVRAPGKHDLTAPTTVMQALVESGGFQDFADTKHIIINRGNGAQILKFNYNDVIKGKNIKQNIFLQPGDVIVVK